MCFDPPTLIHWYYAQSRPRHWKMSFPASLPTRQICLERYHLWLWWPTEEMITWVECVYEYAKFQGQQRHLINIYGRWLLHMCSSANPRVYKKNHLSWDPNREVWLPSIVFEEKQLKHHWSLPGYLGQFLHVSLLMVISTSGNYLQSFN